MTTTTANITGRLHLTENERPTFGNLLFNWVWYWLIAHFVNVWSGSFFGSFLRIFALLIAINATVQYLLIPKFTTWLEIAQNKDPKPISAVENYDRNIEESTKNSIISVVENNSKYCPQCGNITKSSAQYCGSCGIKLY